MWGSSKHSSDVPHSRNFSVFRTVANAWHPTVRPRRLRNVTKPYVVSLGTGAEAKYKYVHVSKMGVVEETLN